MEGPGLDQRILARRRVEHEQSVVRRAVAGLGQRPAHLLQFFHQVHIGVQPTGRVHEHDVGTPGLGGLHRVEHDGAGVRPLLGADDVGSGSIGPHLQLGDGAGTEGVPRRHENLATRLGVALRQFADRRRLANAVDAHHEHHVGPCRQVTGVEAFATGQDRFQFGAKHVEDIGVWCLARTDSQPVDDGQGRVHAHVGTDQDLFDLFERVVVQAAADDDIGNAVDHGGPRARQAGADTVEKAGAQEGSTPAKNTLFDRGIDDIEHRFVLQVDLARFRQPPAA